LSEFRVLKDFNRLIINKNLIKTITQKSGFNSLEYISIEDNLIADWKSFDQLNEFGQAVAGQFGQAKKIK
jgi:Leucine-rich repeat (LRR) protein